jgi:hypothetical protein
MGFANAITYDEALTQARYAHWADDAVQLGHLLQQ